MTILSLVTASTVLRFARLSIERLSGRFTEGTEGVR
jgi:hypothetical protein